MNFVEQLFTQLLACNTSSGSTSSSTGTDASQQHPSNDTSAIANNNTPLHIPSSTTKYRNKITYSCCTKEVNEERHNNSLVNNHHHDTTNRSDHSDPTLTGTASPMTNSSTLKQTRQQTVISDESYSILAEDYINDICRTIIEFWQLYMDEKCHVGNNHHKQSQQNNFVNTAINHPDIGATPTATHDDGDDERASTGTNTAVLLREMMVKGTRSRRSIIIRLTIQFATTPLSLMEEEDNVSGSSSRSKRPTININCDDNHDKTDDDHWNHIHKKYHTEPTPSSSSSTTTSTAPKWDADQQLQFRQFIEKRYPEHEFCICYNIMTQNTNIRPMKDASPLHFISSLPSSTEINSVNHHQSVHSQQQQVTKETTLKYVMEMTPNHIEYQISPDTFSEVNHPVELLQWQQTKEYIDEFYHQYSGHSHPSETQTSRERLLPKPILIVSGRDISAFALGFGTLFIMPPTLPHQQRLLIDNFCEDKTNTTVDNDTQQPLQYMFHHVIAIQHCPLVHYDAVQNIQRYQQNQTKLPGQRERDSVVCTPTFSVYHCTKATMVHSFQKELLKESTKYIPVFGVMTGGRKGLDVSYVNFLNKHTPIQGIVYNSCATKSLLRDMTGFILRGPYYLDHFRSYDFLPNTPYTASLTKLIRRPRSLIILIGPAGVGKSTMVKTLLRQYSTSGHETKDTMNNITWWERDRIFTVLRNRGVSLAKTKSLVHASLMKVLRPCCDEDKIDSQHADSAAVIIIDSTNGNAEGRQLYIKEAKPEVVIYVHFKIDESDDENVIEYLLDCTKYRLNNNTDQHPSFPQSIEEQRIKHRNILRGMEYPTVEELEQIQKDNFPTVKRTVLLTCDPRNAQCRSQLPYKVFLEYTTSAEIRDALLHSSEH